MNNKINYINYILSFSIATLLFLIFIGGFGSNSLAYCTIQPGYTGCCTSCSGWYQQCYAGDAPTVCGAPEGQCDCNTLWCNSATYGACVTPTNPEENGQLHDCDTCCCTLEGGSGGGTWRGIRGYVWSDFNNDGVLNSITDPSRIQFYHEEYRGDPFDIGDCSTEAVYPTNDFSVIISGSGIDTPENIARNWHCFGTPRIGTQKYEYYSHLNDYNEDNNAGMVRNGQYVATLGNIPADSSCGEWEVFDPAEGETWTLQRRGSGCDANFTMTATNDYMKINWKLGPPLCTPQNGNLSDWSHCSNGSQTSTCEGATSCPVGCTPGESGCVSGSCSAECTNKGGIYDPSTNICTRSCLRVEGNIWSDDDNDGIKEESDYWIGKYPDSEGNYNCTPKVFRSFGLKISEQGESDFLNPMPYWFCHGTLNTAYYHTTIPNNIKPGSTINVTLTNIMDGYDVAFWEYINQADGKVASGSSNNTDDITMPKSGWVNVNWELKQQTYNLTINVKKIRPEIIDLPVRCGDTDIYDGDLQGAQITITDADGTGALLCSGTSNNEGNLTCPIWILQGALHITATKPGEGFTPETYSLECPNDNVYVYDPGTTLKGDSRIAEIGLQTVYKPGWVSAIDSDVFANLLSVVVPDGPTDNSDSGQTPQGFAKTLINSSSNNDNSLGFAFSETGGTNNSPNTPSKIFESSSGNELGGNAYNLLCNSIEHDSKWLENFSFKAPENADPYTPKDSVFESGKIYKAEPSKDPILPDIYNIENGNSIAILYVEGDLTIDDNLTTSSDGRLLIVVNGSVTIKPKVGTGRVEPPFDISLNPHIMAGIIAREQIKFESKGSPITSTSHDSPLIVSAPLISKNSISFARDLYHDNNATMPAESAKAFNKYLYLLTSLEREKSQDNLYFTGLTTYDLDWEYIY